MKKLLITVNGKRYEVDVEIVQDDEAGETPVALRPPAQAVEAPAPPAIAPVVAPAAGKAKLKKTGADKKSLTSPINGVVLDIMVKQGDEVKLNDVLFVLEAMKMKTNISSPQHGTVKAIKVEVGDKIEAGQILLTFE
jgi:glutaconyl-CoA/methylmalonyl-CoA decarboxylase subunit gamma